MFMLYSSKEAQFIENWSSVTEEEKFSKLMVYSLEFSRFLEKADCYLTVTPKCYDFPSKAVHSLFARET
jgi:hypothetical protein